MPVVLRVKGFTFRFYEADLDEPPHVHVRKEGKEAKYWLDPVRIARAGRFKPANLREAERIINDNLEFLLSAWQEEQRKRANG
jgi:hypothetical protein